MDTLFFNGNEESELVKETSPLDAMDYVSIVYESGLIDWNVYQKVMDRIRTNMNGSWMFEQKEDENGKK